MTVKQDSGSADCVAATAAMITSTTITEFKQWIKDRYPDEQEQPYTDWHLHHYCCEYGYVIGIGFNVRFREKEITTNSEQLKLAIALKDFPAYVVVKSRNYADTTHAMYWDGEHLHDPDPQVEKPLPLSEYEIYEWWPVINVRSKSIPGEPV